MEKIFSVRIILKYSKELYEESVIAVKLNSVDEIKNKVDLYVENLNKNNEEKIFELVSIQDYYEIESNINIEDNFADVYSRFLNRDELKAYVL